MVDSWPNTGVRVPRGTLGLNAELSWGCLCTGFVQEHPRGASPSQSLLKVSFPPAAGSLHQQNGRHPIGRLSSLLAAACSRDA